MLTSITALSSKDIYMEIDNKLDSTCVEMSSIILQEVRVKLCRQREMIQKKIFGSSHAKMSLVLPSVHT